MSTQQTTDVGGAVRALVVEIAGAQPRPGSASEAAEVARTLRRALAHVAAAVAELDAELRAVLRASDPDAGRPAEAGGRRCRCVRAEVLPADAPAGRIWHSEACRKRTARADART